MTTQARLRSDVSILSATQYDAAHPVRYVADFGEPLWIVWEACGHFAVVAGIVAARNDYAAYEALIDELPTVPLADEHEAYGFDTDADFRAAIDNVWPKEWPDGCGPELAEGYTHQANANDTGIVWTQDLGWPVPLTRTVLDEAEIDLRLGRDE